MKTYKITFRLENALVNMSTKVKATSVQSATIRGTEKIRKDCKGQKFEILKTELV